MNLMSPSLISFTVVTIRDTHQNFKTSERFVDEEFIILKIVQLLFHLFLGWARFPKLVQNFSERQILWSLCSVDFHTLTLQLPFQTLHSVAPELQIFVSSLENCQNFNKTSTPLNPPILIKSTNYTRTFYSKMSLRPNEQSSENLSRRLQSHTQLWRMISEKFNRF